MRRIAFHSLFVLTLSSFWACQSIEVEDVVNVNPGRVHQSLTVTYSENEEALSARAQFRFGGSTGTTLRLTNDCKVLFDGEEMGGNEQFLQGMVYSTRSGGGFQPGRHEFSYHDLDGSTFANSVSLRSFGSIMVPQTIDVNEDAVITWTGESLVAGEEVSIYISGEKGKSASLTIKMTGANRVVLEPKHMKNLFDGPAELSLSRSTSQPVTEGTEVGGTISGIYKAKDLSLQITGRPAPKEEEPTQAGESQ